jgi:hypothetical protein
MKIGVTKEEILIADFTSGIDSQRYTSVVAIGKKFILFRIAGYKYWNGRFSGQGYSPVQHVLIRKGQWWLGNETEKREWKGRVPRTTLINAFEQAERAGKVEKI